jgi:excisionase family DNA binding protein
MVPAVVTNKGNDSRKTMTVEEAAAMLGISRASAYECARRGELPVLRFGRHIVVPTAALRRLLETSAPEVTKDAWGDL